jgi:glycosyltransferase involved in cell wall biosynthesis
MRIGIDIGPMLQTRTGVGNYCLYLLKHLLDLASGEEIRAFSSGRTRSPLPPFANGLHHRHISLPTRALYLIWNAFGAPKVDGLLGGVDVYHATNYFLPPTRSAKRVVTIHDLSFLAVPELCSPKIVGPFSRGVQRFAAEADAILAYSESTKRDIVHYLDIDPGKVTIAPLAVDEDFQPMDRAEAEAHLARHYGIQTPFLLFVSTLEPRKNVPGLLRAFARVKDSIPHKLVLVGNVGWNADEIFETVEELRLGDRVVRPGYIPTHSELAAFYSAADLFVFPTFYEGFGLPVLEALQCGCPVIASDNSSLPEVAGDAAAYVKADDAEGLARAIEELVSDPAKRAALAARGPEQARRFSWKHCAEQTLGVYRSVSA